jgi:site-specific DNA-methyltransferase (adenine-specific)
MKLSQRPLFDDALPTMNTKLDPQPNALLQADSLEWMKSQPTDSVDLVFGSPPYEDRREYDELEFRKAGEDWVEWFKPFVREACRISKGLACFVVNSKTDRYQWNATPLLVQADLMREDPRLWFRKPVIFYRYGIPGKRADDFRDDYEFVIRCQKTRGKLPWADPLACGKPPKYKPGGSMSYRTVAGDRVNQKEGSTFKERPNGGFPATDSRPGYQPPKIANPGNVRLCDNYALALAEDRLSIGDVVKCSVGGGNMGHELATENEAPFPEDLAEFFIRSFCPLDGIVVDPFSGSATTASVAERFGRRWIGIDMRFSQVELGFKRVRNQHPQAKFQALVKKYEKRACTPSTAT